METDRETGWRKIRANRAVRKRNAHAYASERITPGRKTAKAARTNYFFFGLPYAYTQTDADKRACTQGYKK